MKKKRKTNIASVRTKKLIQDVFVQLLDEKGDFDQVNVTDLVKRADICRSTFYKHYQSIDEVAQAIRKEVAKEFFADFQVNNCDEVDVLFDKIYRFLRHHDRFFGLVMKSEKSLAALITAGENTKKLIISMMLADEQIVNREYLETEINILCDGLMLNLIRYYRGESSVSLKAIINATKLSYNNLRRWRSQRPA